MRRRASLIALAGAALLAAACGGNEHKKVQAAEEPVIPVQTVAAQRIDWPSVYEAVGTVRSRNSATVASKVMGYIREMRVKAGDRVSAGQLLAVIDSRDLEAAHQQAQAGVAEARSGIAEADNGIAAANAQLELAQVTFKRMEDLFQQRSISNQEFDEARSRLRVAQANFEMAQAKRRQLDSRIEQAQQAARAAGVTRSYANIHAPFAGVVTEKQASQGDMAAPGSPLLTIEQAGGYNLEVPVEEQRLGAIRVGTAVSVKLEAFEQPSAAKVAEIVPAVDPSSRSFLVKVGLPADQRVRSGMFGRAMFTFGQRSALALPRSSVRQMGQVQTVFIAQGDTARARLVSLGEPGGDNIEVLSGVAADERVIAPVPPGLRDGSKIEVRR